MIIKATGMGIVAAAIIGMAVSSVVVAMAAGAITVVATAETTGTNAAATRAPTAVGARTTVAGDGHDIRNRRLSYDVHLERACNRQINRHLAR